MIILGLSSQELSSGLLRHMRDTALGRLEPTELQEMINRMSLDVIETQSSPAICKPYVFRSLKLIKKNL